jgi:hypothetical protein
MKKVDKSSFAGTKVDSEQVFKTRRSAKPIAKHNVRRSLLIHFTDVYVCLDSLKDMGIKISPRLRNFIKLIHNSVMITIADLPDKIVAEVCFRAANRILSSIEMETRVRFIRYKRSDYELV